MLMKWLMLFAGILLLAIAAFTCVAGVTGIYLFHREEYGIAVDYKVMNWSVGLVVASGTTFMASVAAITGALFKKPWVW